MKPAWAGLGLRFDRIGHEKIPSIRYREKTQHKPANQKKRTREPSQRSQGEIFLQFLTTEGATSLLYAFFYPFILAVIADPEFYANMVIFQ